MSEINREVLEKCLKANEKHEQRLAKIKEIREFLNLCWKLDLCPLCGNSLLYSEVVMRKFIHNITHCPQCDIVIHHRRKLHDGFYPDNPMYDLFATDFMDDTYPRLSDLIKELEKELL